MSQCVNRRVRPGVLALLAVVGWWMVPAAAQAQTTVILDAPNTESIDTTIQGGASATRNFGTQVLMTRASDNPDYARRALLKFDTESTIPARAVIQSATLTLTVKGGNSETRTLSAYRLVNSFDQDAATWKIRKSGYNWSTTGGDLGSKYGQGTVTGTVGSKVTIDVTRLVQDVVNAPSGESRWSRVALVDNGASTYLSYREFHNSESSSTSSRPVLKVVYGGTAVAAPTAPVADEEEEAAPAPAPAPTGSMLRLVHWNTHHGGRRTDGVFDMDLLVNWLASFNAHVISLNEVDNRDQATQIASKLKTKTGITWAWHYDDRGNQVLARMSLTGQSNCLVNPTYNRKAAHVGVVFNGRPINVWSAHLGLESSAGRTAEVRALKVCETGWAQAWIAAGDYNMQAGTTEYNTIATDHWDAWRSAPVKLNYSGNCDGCTRNSRIDYVFSSKGATWLVLKQVQIPDTRNASGVMPSDHKPMIVTYEVR
jgi:endonuclease/exonuclease/phosphatase family metal-dependent hydrolase